MNNCYTHGSLGGGPAASSAQEQNSNRAFVGVPCTAAEVESRGEILRCLNDLEKELASNVDLLCTVVKKLNPVLGAEQPCQEQKPLPNVQTPIGEMLSHNIMTSRRVTELALSILNRLQL